MSTSKAHNKKSSQKKKEEEEIQKQKCVINSKG